MSGTNKTPPFDDLRIKLVKQRAALLEGLSANPGAAETVELDQTRQGRVSRMDAMQQQAMAVANRATSHNHIAAIDAALARMEAGGYGDCLECGEEIAPARLAARPEARLCIVCKSRSEQQ